MRQITRGNTMWIVELALSPPYTIVVALVILIISPVAPTVSVDRANAQITAESQTILRVLPPGARQDLRIDRTEGGVGEEKHASRKENSARNRSIAWHRPSHSTGYGQCRRLRACPLRKVTK